MRIFNKINSLILPSLLLSTLTVANDNIYDNSIGFDAVGANIGYAHMYYDQSGSSVTHQPSADFLNFEIYTHLKNVFEDRSIKPTINYVLNTNSDMSNDTFLVGVNKFHYFDKFDAYYGALIGYGGLKWKYDPLVSSISNDLSSTSIVGGLQGGLEFPMTNSLSFNLNSKYLLHDYVMQVSTPSQSAKFTHNATFSLALGLKWTFGRVQDRIDEELIEIESTDYIEEDIDMIDARTCAQDSDYDGVIDAQDRCKNTPRNVTVDGYGCVNTSTADADLKDFDFNIMFKYKSANIPNEYDAKILELAYYLKKYPRQKVFMKSHTDSVGSEAYNMRLSQTRAETVYTQLIALGVSRHRLSYEAFGESAPIATNATEAGRAKNRRLEVIITQ